MLKWEQSCNPFIMNWIKTHYLYQRICSINCPILYTTVRMKNKCKSVTIRPGMSDTNINLESARNSLIGAFLITTAMINASVLFSVLNKGKWLIFFILVRVNTMILCYFNSRYAYQPTLNMDSKEKCQQGKKHMLKNKLRSFRHAITSNCSRGFGHHDSRRCVDSNCVFMVVVVVVVVGLVALRKTVGCIVISQIWCDPKTIQTTTSSQSSQCFHLDSSSSPCQRAHNLEMGETVPQRWVGLWKYWSLLKQAHGGF
ncbi:hypothetical protein CRENBAI_018988 [Crenichthys baileyi]|uniref:Transmembrane protein n=1 Tax=Crenichthys baileyi TaxID=28760 RepID=A0AAV9RLH0_9TELE